MKLFNWFGKKTPPQETETTNDGEALEIYSGMRVEVTDLTGQMLFVAKLMGLHGNQAELHQYSESAAARTEEPLPVRIRGYSDRDRKAVYMEGVVTPLPQSKWEVAELNVCGTGNDRAFFRLDVNLEATAAMYSGLDAEEKPCRLLNISIGGAYISSEYQYHEGDKFLLKVKLLEDRPESAMFSQVMRVIEKDETVFEYGCRFLELSEEEQDKITQNIFAFQRRKRGGS